MKKVFTIIIAMVLILLVVIGVTYRYAENNDFFFPQISQQLQEKTGFVFAKTGALELSLLPRPELTVLFGGF